MVHRITKSYLDEFTEADLDELCPKKDGEGIIAQTNRANYNLALSWFEDCKRRDIPAAITQPGKNNKTENSSATMSGVRAVDSEPARASRERYSWSATGSVGC